MDFSRWRRRMRGAVRRALDPCEPPPGWEVLPEDWVEAGNGLRRVLGYEPYTGPPRYPTIEEMTEWEQAFPGSAESFRRCAKICSEIRFWRSLRDLPPPG